MYLIKKQKLVEEKLKKEKEHMAQEMVTINKRINFLKKQKTMGSSRDIRFFSSSQKNVFTPLNR
jgi:hypothetical protein